MLLTQKRRPSPALEQPDNGLQPRPPRESLTALARNLYQTILRLGGTPSGSVFALTPARPAEVRSALDELTRLGLVVTDENQISPVLYHDAVDTLLTTQARSLENALAEVREAQRRLRVLFRESAWLGGDSVGTVVPTMADDGHMSEARMQPRVELSAMHPGARFDDELLSNSLSRAQADLAAGIGLRVIHQSAALSHQHTTEYLREVERLGGQVRLRRDLPFRLILIDGETAVCRMPWQNGAEETLLLRGARMLGLLGRLFETTWVDSLPLVSLLEDPPAAEIGRVTGPVSALTDDHKMIMRYLADGATDHAIAHSLGVTTRTVTRRMNEIYQALGVQSRFQAGATARRMGLI